MSASWHMSVRVRARIRLMATAMGMAALAPVLWAPEALAQRAVLLEVEEKGDYARIIAKWADGDENSPAIEAEVQSRVLLVRFPEPVTLNLEGVQDKAPSWVALARLDPDGRTARFALKEQDTRLHLSSSIDLLAVDVMREDKAGDPPDVVSPLVAERARRAAAAKVAEIPPPVPMVDGLEVRASEAGGRSRIAFYWPQEVEYETVSENGVYSIMFDHRATPDVARLKISPPAMVSSVAMANSDKGLKFDFGISRNVKPTAYAEENTIVIDLAGPEAERIARAETKAREQAHREIEEAALLKKQAEERAQKKAAQIVEGTHADTNSDHADNSAAHSDDAHETQDDHAPVQYGATESAPARYSPSQYALTNHDKDNDASKDHAADASAAASAHVESDSKAGVHETSSHDGERDVKAPDAHTPVPQAPDKRPVAVLAERPEGEGLGPMRLLPTSSAEAAENAPRETFLRGGWPDPAPANGKVKVTIASTASGMEITVPWAAPAPAAVFYRAPAVWVVFAADADLEIDPNEIPIQYVVDEIRQDRAVMLRVEAPEGLVASARPDGPTWIISFSPANVRPERFLKPVREVSDTGRYSIETPLIGAAGIVWFTDPAIGDDLAAAVAFAPTAASTTPRMFVEAEMPATSHGLAIIPHSDDVAVSLVEERVVISSSQGMAVSSANAGTVASYTRMKDDTPTPGFIDFDAWGGLGGNAFFARKSELSRAAAAREPASKAGADVLMELARFYVAHDMGPEALGALNMVKSSRPLLEQEARFLSLRAAANIMLQRYAVAEVDLSKGSLRGDQSASIWRGYAAAGMGQWERANDFFKQGEDLIFAYSDHWAARFYVKAAEAALKTGDLDRARRLAELAAGSRYEEPAENAQLLLAQLSEVTGAPEKAYKQYESLTSGTSEPVAVVAELHRLDLGVRLGKVTPVDAADQLEALRFRWRGDSTEMATVGILADQYMRLGRFREALLLAQAAALREPDAPGARELRLRLMDYFRRLYLDGEAERLDPIQALALFYEFKALTPIGSDGDRMIRKLARRLVAFDLLDPATELLQHQVDNRVRGQGKAAIAVDLASIYLMDKRPDRALAAINASRQPRLPKELALERRLLEAAAYRDMGRHDHAIELLEGVAGKEAASLRADSYWQSQNWVAASRALAGMLPPAQSADESHADLALKAAIAGRMAKDMGLLSNLRNQYGFLFEGGANAESFDLITSQTDISGAALSEAVRRMADAPRVDAFAASMKRRFEGDGGA